MTAGENVVVVRYGEIALKGGNRFLFERKLRLEVKHALKAFAHGIVERTRGRIVVRGPEDVFACAARAADVFGVTSTSPGISVERDVEVMKAKAVELFRLLLERRGAPTGKGVTMRIAASRADKTFPLTSVDLNRAIAGPVLAAFPDLKVDLDHPDLTLGLELRSREALLFADRMRGPGGLPVGTQGKALALLSGGIDSPVAAWLAMKRGLRLELLHFHAAPFVGEASRQKAVDLARALARHVAMIKLHVVPLADVQVAIQERAPEPYRTLLYRRAMNRIATRLATEIEAKALVTGESLGQVASQTLENLRCIEDAAGCLVLRPLVGFDKDEIVTLARKIDTLDISARPHPDCCTLFQPLHPKIRGDVEELRTIEKELALEPLLDAAAAARETLPLRW